MDLICPDLNSNWPPKSSSLIQNEEENYEIMNSPLLLFHQNKNKSKLMGDIYSSKHPLKKEGSDLSCAKARISPLKNGEDDSLKTKCQ